MDLDRRRAGRDRGVHYFPSIAEEVGALRGQQSKDSNQLVRSSGQRAEHDLANIRVPEALGTGV